MAATTRLQRLATKDLDDQIADWKRRGIRKLILLGPGVEIGDSEEEGLQGPVVYQLVEFVPRLDQRIAALKQLTRLDLRGNGIRSAASLTALTQLSSLNLSGNQIGAAGAASLAALTQLTSLDLSGNRIGDAGAASLAALTQLTSLNLSDNQIRDAGAASLVVLTQLNSLCLSINQIGDAGAAALAALTQLTFLNLGSNQIGDAGTASLAALTQLTSLKLWTNKIGAAGAASLADLTQLTSLDLSHNQIGAAGAASLAALTQLTSLCLSNNQIGDTGTAPLAALTQLTSLALWHNAIGDAGAAALAALNQLTSLNLDFNEIGDAGAAALAALTQLTSLSLVANDIGDAGAAALAALTQLTSLDLTHNQIGDVGTAPLVALTKLTTLRLWNNKIGDAGAASLAFLTQLTSLNLGRNRIGDAGAASLAALTQLTFLSLAYNDIGDAGAASLCTLENLRCLDITENRVQDLSPLMPLLKGGLQAIWDEPGTGGILVHGCPLVHPPPEIVQQGHEAVLNYLGEIEAQGIDHLYEAKVLILGEGGAGKTSLLRRLYRQDLGLPQEEESTKGIDIHRAAFSTADGKPFRLNVWDFGGQQIYHATHQFFLTKRSLYVLVDDTKNNSTTVHDEGFKYWLEVIEALSESCPVLIFQNEKAGRSKTIDAAGIKGRFPNVIEIYRGNLDHADAAKELGEAIRLKVQQLPHVSDAVPAQWVAIRQELEEMKAKRPYITQAEYFQIYGKYLEQDRTKALRLSQYFHDLGVCLHYQAPEDPLLARYVILQNEWATEAVFKVLDDEPTKANKGSFSREDCRRIWSESTYVDMHPELLALMEKFELCYKLPDQKPDTWLAPQLLSPSTPEVFKAWAKPSDLVLTYQYSFLPKGMVSRLLVRNHHLVRQLNHCWSQGACFERGTSELLARVTETGQAVELRARGPERKALMSVIATDLDLLNASFEGLRDKVQKLVPCICSRCRQSLEPVLFREEELQERKRNGKATIECRVQPYDDVSVHELLDGLKLAELPQWATQPERERSTTEDSTCEQAKKQRPDTTKIIHIFLASSSELKEDRDVLDLYLRQENDQLHEHGIYLQVHRWENFLDAMSPTRLQDEYNTTAKECDIFVSLFKTKMGQFTGEEFQAAYNAFKEKGKPYVFTYFLDAQVSIESITNEFNSRLNFKKKLQDLGHYPTIYENIQDLKLQFRRQIDTLIAQQKL